MTGASGAYALLHAEAGRRAQAVVSLIALGMIIFLFFGQPFKVLQYLIFWMIGALFYLRTISGWRVFANRILHGITVLGILAILYYAVTQRPPNPFSGALGVRDLPLIPFKAVLLIMAARFLPYLKWLPFRRLFAILAHSSYTLYVLHFPVLCLAFSLIHERYHYWSLFRRSTFLICLVISILVTCHYLAMLLENKTFWITQIKRVTALPEYLAIQYRRVFWRNDLS